MFDRGLKHRSGRVIALGRFVLSAIFLFSIWIDSSQPARNAPETYWLLASYVAAAGLVGAATWNSWWLDARLAGPAHWLDVFVFGLLMFSTDGYTSPFFLFFVFIMLSSAIRWGWRQTALTGAALIVMYFAAAALAGVASDQFEYQRFVLRGTHLVILSAILIWFGINQGAPQWTFEGKLLGDISPDESPLPSALKAALRSTEATFGVLIWRASEAHSLTVLCGRTGDEPEARSIEWDGDPDSHPRAPFLFDLARDRALAGGGGRGFRFFTASSALDRSALGPLSDMQGLGVPFSADTGNGLLLLGGIRGLSLDYLSLGEQLAPAIELHIQRHALLSAAQHNAVAHARLALSRDLHDSIVQFLAGACFQVEALTRSARSGSAIVDQLASLKQMLLEEQQELRSSIGAMRSEEVGLIDLAANLEKLCARLARQWGVHCSFDAQVSAAAVPMRLHFDTHQLVREAVANAARHAAPTAIRVSLSEEGGSLRLDIVNDGGGAEPLAPGAPWSLRERVDEADGNLMLATRNGSTTVSITLPLRSSAT
ncbi:hypothetical protein G7078_00810 [Sphingomonas sinipercae]|uniref:Signal transduction histidine kinase subgroup 3 dimerisation and phosphoacceptor domain-containing protein n=1 Tax=Sphingomonas sinipercae TaxID=2714944 RepID=A0A6G7ZKN3_9SPHN|nr:histidine kinase [Sphingomonas sinipercae]QIL01470.1 hypothetical protein G7078_00810 [Sphingomonas sinipercae]